MEQKPFPLSADPLVQALQSLVRKTRGGYKTVAEKIGANDQSLYQVVACRADSKTGRPKSVGKQLRDKLDHAYPGWLDSDPAPLKTHQPSLLSLAASAPSEEDPDALVKALRVIDDAIAPLDSQARGTAVRVLNELLVPGQADLVADLLSTVIRSHLNKLRAA